jgi:dihydroorotase
MGFIDGSAHGPARAEGSFSFKTARAMLASGF